MRLRKAHIDRIMELHQQFGRPFTSRQEAADYLLTLCKLFDWLLRHKSPNKN